MCKRLLCFCLWLLLLSFPIYASATDSVNFSLYDAEVSQNKTFVTTLSADSAVASFVAHLEFDGEVLEFKDAKPSDSSAELSTNCENGRLTLVYLNSRGEKGGLVTLSFKAEGSNTSIALSVEQAIDSMGNEVSVASVNDARITLNQGSQKADTSNESPTLTESITKVTFESEKDCQETSVIDDIIYISLPAKEGGDFTPLMLIAGIFTLTLGIGVIAFILGRGTNKTNGKDNNEKDS